MDVTKRQNSVFLPITPSYQSQQRQLRDIGPSRWGSKAAVLGAWSSEVCSRTSLSRLLFELGTINTTLETLATFIFPRYVKESIRPWKGNKLRLKWQSACYLLLSCHLEDNQSPQEKSFGGIEALEEERKSLRCTPSIKSQSILGEKATDTIANSPLKT